MVTSPACRMAGWLVLLVLVYGVSPAAAQEEAALDAQRHRLEQLQQEIAEKRAEADRLGVRETSVLSELRSLERELGVTQNLIDTLKQEIDQRTEEIAGVTRQLARAQDELAVKRRVLGRRLRSIHKLGRYGNFEILLMADSFAEILGRYKYLRLIAEQDGRLIKRIARLEAEIRSNRATLETARDQLAGVREQRVQQVATLSAAEQDRQRVLTRVKNQRSEQLRAAEALEAETEKIQALMVTLERRRAEREEAVRRAAADAGRTAPEPVASTLTGEFGTLEWPVDGDIIATFGRSVHPVYRTEIVNNGIDIRAARGTPIRAVESGEVVYADWNGGYGLMVILDHEGGYYSLYAHLDRSSVSVGDTINRGTVVGTVGETGSLVGPKLHFEIRKGGRAVDPVGWLRER